MGVSANAWSGKRVALHPLLTGSGQVADASVAQSDSAQRVVHGVCDDHVVAHLLANVGRKQAQAVGFAELRGLGAFPIDSRVFRCRCV